MCCLFLLDRKIYGFLNGYKTIYESLLFHSTNRCNPQTFLVIYFRFFLWTRRGDINIIIWSLKNSAKSSLGFPATSCSKSLDIHKKKLSLRHDFQPFSISLLSHQIDLWWIREKFTNWISVLGAQIFPFISRFKNNFASKFIAISCLFNYLQPLFEIFCGWLEVLKIKIR